MQTDTITLRELTIRYTVKTDTAGEPIVVGRKVSTPADSAAVFTTMLQDEASEVFAILCLSTKHRVLAYHEVSRGCWTPRWCIRARSSKPPSSRTPRAIVLAHNHPSGDPTPSPDDMALTRRLVDAGRLIGVDVLDHIVIGDGRHVSFRERGWLA